MLLISCDGAALTCTVQLASQRQARAIQSAIRRAFVWKNGNEIHTAVTRRRDREYH